MMLTPLRKARIKANLTILQVCTAVECDPGNLSRMERGLQKPTPLMAERLAKLFPGEVDELMILYPERYLNSKSNAT
ncbi:helix-turn-helix domain-containing protein [Pantoea brenneri]|uniref:helix-turn-helix domain-containing protein n=1 Tax=Pantoea brenneri TaxID=472694 RepID=UPI002446C578|nr:helix-turn-helix transcriptional regulator [Pantoea brenneri]MDH1085967.1 helix-turn-helix domain-containing protein [Pantoea brenneri]